MSDKTTPLRFPDEGRAALALTLVADVGTVRHRQLIARFRTAARALNEGFPTEVAAKAYRDAGEMLVRADASRLALTTIGEPHYPPPLLELTDPPAVLWSLGDWATLQSPVVAVVGTRRATAYGERIARMLSTSLAQAGACVVSGMALGIDAIAHSAALDAGGRTIAVLGTGADVPYPRAHVALHREIVKRGLVLSEMTPGSRSDPGSFPRRNRIIAGLADLTIVVEAPARSGALITSKYAIELGRDVAAVPGPIDMPQSEGTNELIRDGAHAITSVADLLALVGLQQTVRSLPAFEDPAEERIWTVLHERVASLDELCDRAALPVAQCLTAVTRLELRGFVECALTGEIRRR